MSEKRTPTVGLPQSEQAGASERVPDPEEPRPGRHGEPPESASASALLEEADGTGPPIEPGPGGSRSGRRDFAQVSRGAAISFLGTVIGMVSGLLVTMLLTRTLGVDRYGAIAVAVSVSTLTQTLSGLGLGQGTPRMMAFALGEHDEPRAMRQFKAGLIGATITGVLGTAIVLVIGLADLMGEPEASTAAAVIAPVVLASGLRGVVFGGLRAYRDLRAILVLGIAAPVLDVVAVGALVVAGFTGVTAFAGALVVVAFVELGVATYFVRRGRRIGPIRDTTLVDLRTLVAFSVPLVITQLMFFGIKSTDVLLLGLLRSPAEAGLYAPVMRLAEAATKALSAFTVIFLPVATVYVAQGRTQELKDLYVKIAKWGYLLGFPVLLVLVSVSNGILPLLFGDAYAGTETLARVLCIGYFATLVTGLNGPTLGSVGAVKAIASLSTIGMAVNVGMGFLLIPHFGEIGAAWSNTLSLIFVNAAFSIALYRRTGILPFRRDSALLIAYSGVVAVAAAALARLPVFGSGTGAVVLAVAASAVWLVGAVVGRPFDTHWREMRDALLRGGKSPARTRDAG